MNEMEYDISVIVPVYNAGALINRCLDSIFSQSTRHRIEVVLIDDGSTDNSVMRIRNRMEPDIVLISQQNAGPSVARNRGIRLARGRYLAFLDADDYWLPGFLDMTVDFLDMHPECIAVNTAQRHVTVSGEHLAPANAESLVPAEGAVLEDFYVFWAKNNHLCTGSILIRTEVVRATGGLREDLRICEDLEFWAFLGSFGKIAFIPRLLFVSDGGRVTSELGWVEKNLQRWKSAVPVEVWEQRLRTRFPVSLPAGLDAIRGSVARNLTYSILLSERYKLAREQIRRNGVYFPKDRMTRVMRVAASNSFLWFIISRLMVYREYHRK